MLECQDFTSFIQQLDIHIYPAYIKDVAGDWPLLTNKSTMEITRPHLQELTEVIEDTIEYACDKYTLSGELAWTVVLCLATAKIEELKGTIAPE